MYDYPPLLQRIIDRAPEMPLDAGELAFSSCGFVGDAVQFGDVFGPAGPAHMGWAELCRAGLLLHYNDLEGAHGIVMSRTDPEACLWHGILHRREGDFPNARYWMDRGGNHDVYGYLAEGAAAILARIEGLDLARLENEIKAWDAILFVKLCERGLAEGGPLRDFALQVQDLEWQILFHYCYQRAAA